ncbi:hypothetical protein PISMIDRAFT_677100 [Pisolithus microcarpus 441]|uniref:Uncharacterized protein n=1 Tax=Pisolithus microcarpus 441 TaxID=765257 RepID=A0A0C9ZIF2_9AGAM|nr:hypothetical protein PISMIDRAFT_677100 [Pisolithus microcarpus 441]
MERVMRWKLVFANEYSIFILRNHLGWAHRDPFEHALKQEHAPPPVQTAGSLAAADVDHATHVSHSRT